MKHFISVLILILSFNSFSQSKIKVGSQEEDIYSLNLNSTDLSNDLLQLKPLLADKEIVGMGEATHGTKEFFELKSKTFQYLVTNCNFKVFGIEASMGGCSYINDYIQGGAGNIDTIMRSFDFWIWRTEEVKDLVSWMKAYNQQKSDTEKISFYGFDMQNIYSPLKYINDFFKLDTLSDLKELKNISSPVLSKSDKRIKALLWDSKIKFRDTLFAINTFLQKCLTNKKAYLESKYSGIQLERLAMCAENFNQSFSRPIDDRYRDSCMASNSLKIQKIENGKMFLWAHNEHINIDRPEDYLSKIMGKPMGGHLKKALDTKYYSIGFVFNQGSFQARKCPKTAFGEITSNIFSKGKLYPVQACSVPVNKKNTLTNAFQLTNKNSFFINLNNSTNVLFSTPQYTYGCGANFYYYRSTIEIVAKKQFDGLIYIDKTNNSVAIKQ